MIAAAPTYQTSIDSVSKQEWHALLQRFDDASIYQTWDYGAVRWGENHLSHLVLKRAGTVVGLAQVRLVRVPLIGKGIAYVRWGPLCHLRGERWDEGAFREMIVAVREEYVQRRGLVLRIIPNVFRGDAREGFAKQCLEEMGFSQVLKYHTYRSNRVDLTKSEDEIRRALNGKWRNQLNAAERNGLSVREGTGDELWRCFLSVYWEMMDRKKFETTVDVNEFKRIQQSLPEELKMRIFLGEEDGQVLNALVVSHIGDMGIYLLGATSDEGMKRKGAYLLQWRAVRWLKARGANSYDLGGTNREKNPGVYHFKTGLGGHEVLHLGSFELCDNWLSTTAVTVGERLHKAVARLKI